MVSLTDVERIAAMAAASAAKEAAEAAAEIAAERAATAAVEKVVPIAVETAVTKTLKAYGINTDDQAGAQRNNAWVEANRIRCEKAGTQALLVLLALIVAGVATAVWHGILRGAIDLMPR